MEGIARLPRISVYLEDIGHWCMCLKTLSDVDEVACEN